MARQASGDLTDVTTWERAWQRSPLRGRATGIKRWLVENHHDVLRTFLGQAGEERSLAVLELGCAPGKKLRDLATLAPQHRYAGVDFAPEALDRTRHYLADVGVPAALHLADVRAFEAEPLYDLVVSFGLVEHFDDPLDMISHHARLVRPGGAVGIQIPNYAHPALARALAVYSPRTLATHNLSVMSTDVLARHLRDAGLVEVTTGSYGGSVIPVANVARGPLGTGIRMLATGWNAVARAMPRALSPWQVFLWARGRKPS